MNRPRNIIATPWTATPSLAAIRAVSLLAVGGFIRLLDAVAANECRNGFALVRPPGHHALRNRAMGFCLFNTMAIGAEYLKRVHGAKKILITDWDVHHGNGTQDAFYADPSVMFISTHQYPYYPGSGAANETGSGPGELYDQYSPGDPSGTITVTATDTAGQFTVRLRDHGKKADPASIAPRKLEDVRPGGLGTHFMGQVFDAVTYDTSGGEGTLLILEKKKHQAKS